LGVAVERVSEVEFSVNDPGSNFVIEFHPVEITGEPQCLEHEQLAWVSRDELMQHNLAPSDLLFARHIANQNANGDD
jgi:8-oxo-dGTP pyrophosphatase MutT (NUDIX family)